MSQLVCLIYSFSPLLLPSFPITSFIGSLIRSYAPPLPILLPHFSLPCSTRSHTLPTSRPIPRHIHNANAFDFPSLPAVKKLCSLHYTISCVDIYFDSRGFRSPNVRGKFHNVSIIFKIFLGKATFQFRVLYKGNEIGSVDANYKE